MQELFTISYRSVARVKGSSSDIGAILGESRTRNRRLGITGLLLYDGIYFMQTIEGPREETTDVFVKIAGDNRHTDVVPFGIGEIAERTFPDWRLKLIGPRAAARIVPDMEEFDFSDRRLGEVHTAAKLVADRGPRPGTLMH